MKHKTFFWFFLPTALAMFLFIALPLTSIVSQSLHTPHDAVLVVVESCDPFGCKSETTIDHEASQQIKEEKPQGKWVGFQIYTDRNHLAFKEVGELWENKTNFIDFVSSLKESSILSSNGLYFDLYCVVTPLVILFGFIIALAVNSLHRHLKGLMVFFSLLPMIVTPLFGSLILFWMIDARGIIGSGLQELFADPILSLKGINWPNMDNTYCLWCLALCPFCIHCFLCWTSDCSTRNYRSSND